jgi:hypothetical protein
MTTQDIQAFRDYVLSENTYLGKGFAPAYLEDGHTYVRRSNGNDFEDVSISDNWGNYFYLRFDGDITFPVERSSKVTDCGPGRVGFIDTAPMVMVLVIRDADPSLLLQNIRNTALSYTGLAIIPTAAQLVREIVYAEETNGADGLQSLDRLTIIKIKLTVAKSYRANTCIVDPCICI